MAQSLDIQQIAQSLASIEPAIRQKGFKNLMSSLPRLTVQGTKKVLIGLFYYYWNSDGLKDQMQDRGQIVSFLEQTPRQDRMKWVQEFFMVLTKFWPEIDQHRTDKYLKLLKKVLESTYVWLAGSPDFRELWCSWNDFLSETVIFDPNG